MSEATRSCSASYDEEVDDSFCSASLMPSLSSPGSRCFTLLFSLHFSFLTIPVSLLDILFLLLTFHSADLDFVRFRLNQLTVRIPFFSSKLIF